MELSFAPRKQVVAWLRNGWRLVPSHTYNPADWAILMWLPEVPIAMTETQIQFTGQRFNQEPTSMHERFTSNMSRSRSIANLRRARAA